MSSILERYRSSLIASLNKIDAQGVQALVECLWLAKTQRKQVFICGNGGSAANALHMTNDFLYGIDPKGSAIRVEALSSNAAVLTCLGNDIGYRHIFSHQLKVKGNADDILIVLSGSGNSPNILAALEQAKALNMTTCAVVGFDGGKAKGLADLSIHFEIDDMQIAEDLQLVLGHVLMKELCERNRQE